MKKFMKRAAIAVGVLGCAVGLSLGYCQEDEQLPTSNTKNTEIVLEKKDTTIEQKQLTRDWFIPENSSDLEAKASFSKAVDNSWAEYGAYLSKEIFKNNPSCSLAVFEREITLVGEQIESISNSYGLDAAKQVYSSFFQEMYSEGNAKCKFHIISPQIGKYMAEGIPLSVRWEKLLDEVKNRFGEKYPTRILSYNRERLLKLMNEFDEEERRDKISLFCEGKKDFFSEPLAFIEENGYQVNHRPELFCRRVLQEFPDDFRNSVSWGTIPEIDLGYDYGELLEDHSENPYSSKAIAAKKRFAREVAEEICKKRNKRNSIPSERFLVYRNLVIRNIEIISDIPYDVYLEQEVINSVKDICL